MAFRPWGLVGWVISRCPNVDWGFFGCVGTEMRSLEAWKALTASGRVRKTRMLRILDNPTGYTGRPMYEAETRDRLQRREAEFVAAGGSQSFIVEHSLLEAHAEIISSIDGFIREAGPNIILDITSLPKRFFFPILRRLILADRAAVSNLLLAYAIPGSYASGPLSLNHTDWAHLPLFPGDYSLEPPKHIIVGVGFESLGLPEHLEHASGLPVKLLLPFPAPPSSLQRSWDLVMKLQNYRAPDSMAVYRTNPRDI